ncbi:MAG: Hint domain-containing protein [Maritimibacter sp.]
MSDSILEIFAISDFNDPTGALTETLTGQHWLWLDPKSATLELTGTQPQQVAIGYAEMILGAEQFGSYLCTPLTLDGERFPAGSEIEDAYEAQFVSETGTLYSLTALTIGGRIIGVCFAGQPPEAGSTLTYCGPTQSQRHASAMPSIPSGSLIDTPDGPRPAADLKAGDLVDTLEHGPQPLRWVGSSRHEFIIGKSTEDQPVIIGRDAFGPGLPSRKIALAPHQAVLAPGSELAHVPARRDGYVSAEELLSHDNIWRKRRCREIGYTHLLLDQPATLTCQGLLIECAAPAPQALSALQRAGMIAEKHIEHPQEQAAEAA